MTGSHRREKRPHVTAKQADAALASCYRVLFALVKKLEKDAADWGEFGDQTQPAAGAAAPVEAQVQGA
jgi:hypothetical protein